MLVICTDRSLKQVKLKPTAKMLRAWRQSSEAFAIQHQEGCHLMGHVHSSVPTAPRSFQGFPSLLLSSKPCTRLDPCMAQQRTGSFPVVMLPSHREHPAPLVCALQVLVKVLLSRELLFTYTLGICCYKSLQLFQLLLLDQVISSGES